MSGAAPTIARCLDLNEDHLAEALLGRAQTRALLERMASVSSPNTGAAKVLLVYARLATTACDWIDGDLGVAGHFLVQRRGNGVLQFLTVGGIGVDAGLLQLLLKSF